jgi:serine/threonine protein phosphatase PrpC
MTHCNLNNNSNNLLIGVFDGHGGDQVSHYLSQEFNTRFNDKYSSIKNVEQAITKSTFNLY